MRTEQDLWRYRSGVDVTSDLTGFSVEALDGGIGKIDEATNETSASYMEQGFMQVRLCYPLGQGPAPLEARFFAIRAHFKNGFSPPAVAGVTTTISGTPELGPELEEPGRYCRPVRIPVHAHITA